MYPILFKPIDTILNIRETASSALTRINIYSLRDLLFYKPSSYRIINICPDFSLVREGELIQLELTIENTTNLRSTVQIKATTRNGADGNTYIINLIFFNKNSPLIAKYFRFGSKCTVIGRLQAGNDSWQIIHPKLLFNKELSTPVEPVYPLTYGLTNQQLYSYIRRAITIFEDTIRQKFPDQGIDKMVDNPADNLADDYNYSILTAERPYMFQLLAEVKGLHLLGVKPDKNLIASSFQRVNKQLAIKELFINQVLLHLFKTKQKKKAGQFFYPDKYLQDKVLAQLGFTLTPAQKQVIAEIEQNQALPLVMTRLLQGDVGAGKTLVALLTMLNVVTKAQAALMAPTDLLSYQHYQFFKKALAGTEVKVALLTGKTPAKERTVLKAALENGEINILIGTHALFQKEVNFKELGYVVIDEQHRFGVNQRLQLINKGMNPDILIMSATPIPRSLMLATYGDMEISILAQKPENRLPVITSVVPFAKRKKIIHSLWNLIQAGEKIYWVCPLIEQKDAKPEKEITYNNVMNRFWELDQFYPGQVGILHGKMKNTEKDQIMLQFKEQDIIRILVATTVIEVGIDVPEATLMVIENAEQFGLAQLHQLRGRVGRGAKQSYCVMIYNPNKCSEIARQRLKVIAKSNDGFYIADQDLILRGAGEVLGIRQSGAPQFFFADLARDMAILPELDRLATDSIYSEKTEASDQAEVSGQVEVKEFINFQLDLFSWQGKKIIENG